MQDRATAIADSALRTQRGGDAQRALMDQCMQNVVTAGLEAQRSRTRRELAIFEKDFGKVATLIDSLREGCWRETAARLAGIAESGVRAWLKLADEGNERYLPIATAIRAAEAIAEAECVQLVRAAGQDPRHWTAAAWTLERKFPDRYGRRSPEDTRSGVTVIIGARAEQVQIGVLSAASGSLPPSVIDIPPRDGLE